MSVGQLVDGDNYSFSYRGSVVYGYYSLSDRGFYDSDGSFYPVGSCRNIRPA